MSFNQMPIEVVTEVFQEYVVDLLTSGPSLSRPERMNAIMRLGHMCVPLSDPHPSRWSDCLQLLSDKRTRQAVIANPSIWRTIFLHAPLPVVELFFERARQKQIRIFFDLDYKLARGFSRRQRRNAARLAEHEQYLSTRAAFIRKNMSSFEEFTIRGKKIQGSEELSRSLQTPAPNLQSFSFLFARREMRSCYANIFAGDAPRLQTVHINSSNPWKLDQFQAVTDVTARLANNNCGKIMATIQSIPGVRAIALSGKMKHNDVLLHLLNYPTVHPSCAYFEVTQMESECVVTLLSSVELPAVTKFRIHEFPITVDFGEELPREIVKTTFPLVLASVPGDHVLPTSLRITFCSNTLLMQTNGTPSLQYRSDWCLVTDFDQAGDPLVFAAASDLCRSIATLPQINVTHLSISNRCRPGPRDPPTALSSINASELFAEVLTAYPFLTDLELIGYLDEFIDLMCNEGGLLLPSRPRITIRAFKQPEQVEDFFFDLMRLEAATGCEVEIHLPALVARGIFV